MRLKDKLKSIEQNNFIIDDFEEHLFKYYKNKITYNLIKLKKRGITDYRVTIPCVLYGRLEKYFNSEGMWVIYLGSKDNKRCSVLVCPEITNDELNAIKNRNKKERV